MSKKVRFTKKRKKERKHIITLEQYITRIHDLPHFIKYKVTLKIHAHNTVYAN
jgi:hypothetical protein